MLTRKLHRAFPELRRFGDAEAAAFCKAVGRPFERRVFRGGALLGVVVTLVASAIVLAKVSDALLRQNSTLLVVGLVVLAVGVGVALTVRRVMLGWSVRGVIDRSGICAGCGHTLLGLPIGRGLRIACPGCGRVSVADPSMGQLFTSSRIGAGGDFQEPADVRLRNRKRWRMRRLRRRVTLLAAVAGSLSLTMAMLVRWGQAAQDAKAATADRVGAGDYVAQYERLTLAAQGLTGMPASNGWQTLMAVAMAVEQQGQAVLQSPPARVAEVFEDQRKPMPERVPYWAVWEAPPTRTFLDPEDDRREQDDLTAMHGAQSALAREVVERLKAPAMQGTLGKLETLGPVVRPIVMPANGSGTALEFTDVDLLRRVGRACAARMEVSLGRDREEYLSALRQGLVVARAIESQARLHDGLVGWSVQATLTGRLIEHSDRLPPDWLEPVLLEAQKGRIRADVSHWLASERAASLDSVASMFLTPFHFISSVYIVNAERLFPGYSGWVRGVRGVGRYADNRAEIERWIASAKALSEMTPLEERAAKPRPFEPDTSLIATALTRYDLHNLVRFKRQHELDQQGLALVFAIERYRHHTGGYPASLADLAAVDTDVDLIDPFSGKYFGYRRIDPEQRMIRDDGGGWGRGYLLWSVGYDGRDNDGRRKLFEQSRPMRGEALRPAGSATDEVLNVVD